VGASRLENTIDAWVEIIRWGAFPWVGFGRTEPSFSLPAVVSGSGLVPVVNRAIGRTLCELFCGACEY